MANVHRPAEDPSFDLRNNLFGNSRRLINYQKRPWATRSRIVRPAGVGPDRHGQPDQMI